MPAPASNGASSPQENELEILRRKSPISLISSNPAHTGTGKVREFESQQVASNEAMASLQNDNELLEGISRLY